MGLGPVILTAVIGGGTALATHSGGGGGGGGGNCDEINRIQQQNAANEAERQKKLDQADKSQKEMEEKLKEEKDKLLRTGEEEKEKLKKKLEISEKKRQEEKDEEERKKKEKIKNANDSFQNKKEEYEKNKLNEIKNNFKNSQFCSNQASKLEPFISEQINNIFTNLNDKMKSKIMKNFSDNLENIKNNRKKKNRIILIGKTGVGKSTLINAIFESELAETGFGRPITMDEKPKKYENDRHDDLILYDSRGIEIDPNYDVEINYNKISNFIKEQLEKNEPLDAIWYCITGTRMEEVELNLIKKLKSIYKDNSLSSIIVYTQSVFEEDFNEMKNYLVNTIDNQLIIHNVLAKMKKVDGKIIKSFGLDELISKTKNMIETNSTSVIISTAKTTTEKKIEDIINKNLSIKNDVQFTQIIEKIILSYFENENDVMSETIKNLIQEFYSKYDIKIKTLIEENLNPIINEEAKNICNDLKNIVNNVLNEYDNVISIEENNFYGEYKKKIFELLFNIAHESGKNNINSETAKFIENGIKKYIRNKNKEYISTI